MNEIKFTFSDTIAGYVSSYDRESDTFGLRTSDGREYQRQAKSPTHTGGLPITWMNPANGATPTRSAPCWCQGATCSIMASITPKAAILTMKSSLFIFMAAKENAYGFELADWWVKQIVSIGDFYIRAQFGGRAADLIIAGTAQLSTWQAKRKPITSARKLTLSRAWCMAWPPAYLMTGEDRFLEVAEKGTQYLREHMRFYDADEKVVYWYHGIDVHGNREDKVFASEFGDDLRCHPGLRTNLCPGRPDPDLPHHRRPAHLEGCRNDRGPVRALLSG